MRVCMLRQNKSNLQSIPLVLRQSKFAPPNLPSVNFLANIHISATLWWACRRHFCIHALILIICTVLKTMLIETVIVSICATQDTLTYDAKSTITIREQVASGPDADPSRGNRIEVNILKQDKSKLHSLPLL